MSAASEAKRTRADLEILLGGHAVVTETRPVRNHGRCDITRLAL
jgi:hypothetical protein